MVGEEIAQVTGSEELCLARIVAERDQPFFTPLVKIAVADKVEDLPLAAAQGALQVATCCAFQPMQFDQVGRLERRNRPCQPLPFHRHIQGRQITRRGDQGEDAQGGRHEQGLDWLGPIRDNAPAVSAGKGRDIAPSAGRVDIPTAGWPRPRIGCAAGCVTLCPRGGRALGSRRSGCAPRR